jgi:hypothetical protein
MRKPTSEFFLSLGQYVYQYIDRDTLKPYYTGKGNLDRCWAHVNEKSFDPEDCFIVAKNLERFENKKDWQSFLLESYLIAKSQPEINFVSGHYKECFIMASLSSIFSDFESEQYDNFEKLPDWYLENYDSFRGRVREVRINSTATFIMSNARNQMYTMFTWYPSSEDTIKVSFEIAPTIASDEKKLAEYKKNLIGWLKTEGHKNPSQEGSGEVGNRKFAVNASSIDDVLNLWKSFWS